MKLEKNQEFKKKVKIILKLKKKNGLVKKQERQMGKMKEDE